MAGKAVIAVDAMGGDEGPSPVIAGVARAARRNPGVRFVLVGDQAVISRHMKRYRSLAHCCQIVHAESTVSMTEPPGVALRRRETTSMWGAIQEVAESRAQAVVSCGNTGALAVMAATALKTIPGAERAAIAALWPTRERRRLAVMLDMGAHYTASAEELTAYAVMGSVYARLALDVGQPKVALLNIGTEKLKGHPEVRQADKRIGEIADQAGFSYVGFVEGDQITSNDADVIVTDGFSGNVALKTAEGIARLIRAVIVSTMKRNIFSRLAAVMAYPSIRGLRNWMDPRRLNGGVLLGLNGVVVKSHGRADAKGVEAALQLTIRVAEGNLPQVLMQELAKLKTAP